MTEGALNLEDRKERVRAVVQAARRLADPHDPLGVEARRALPAATGLSEASVEHSLSRHLETSVAPSDLAKLVVRAGAAPRVHVVLSANVFTGVVRAVALAVAAAPSVLVRPSSREAVLAPLLRRALVEQGDAAPFELSERLEPGPGDHVHVYGRSETIAAIRASCPAGVTVRGHGPGFGIGFVSAAPHGETGSAVDLATLASRLSWDIVPFDQRGCMSPRLAFVDGSREDAEHFASCLAAELESREKEVPRGPLTEHERRDAAIYRQTLQAVGQYREAGGGAVGLDVEARAIMLPPSGRFFHVARVASADSLAQLLSPYRGAVTCVGVPAPGQHTLDLAAVVPGARILPLGEMQRPPLDGPVDLREMV
jgi:hypothetical protein